MSNPLNFVFLQRCMLVFNEIQSNFLGLIKQCFIFNKEGVTNISTWGYADIEKIVIYQQKGYFGGVRFFGGRGQEKTMMKILLEVEC